MKKHVLLFLACFAFIANISAQRDETLFGKSGLGFSGAWGGWKHGITAFEDANAVTRGGYGGLEFGKKLFIGYGGFETTDDFAFGENDQSQYDLDYNGLILGYSPFPTKLIHPQASLLFAGGKANVRGDEDRVLVVQPSLGLEMNVFQWFRLGLDGGYRFVSNSDLPETSNQDLSAFYGEFTLKFGWSWGRSR